MKRYSYLLSVLFVAMFFAACSDNPTSPAEEDSTTLLPVGVVHSYNCWLEGSQPENYISEFVIMPSEYGAYDLIIPAIGEHVSCWNVYGVYLYYIDKEIHIKVVDDNGNITDNVIRKSEGTHKYGKDIYTYNICFNSHSGAKDEISFKDNVGIYKFLNYSEYYTGEIYLIESISLIE